MGFSRWRLGPLNEHEAVADGEDDVDHPVIMLNMVVECGDRFIAVALRIQDPAAPQDVVHGDEATGDEPFKGHLVVLDVALFISVDEDQVEGSWDLFKGFQGRAH